MQFIYKGIVQSVNALRHETKGVLSSGAEFTASYYGNTPATGDIVFVTQVADGSWIVLTGPTSAQGLFGVGGDGDVTISASTTSDPANRTTSADGVVSNADLTITSASGAFASSDIGSVISGTGIVAGTFIVSINSSTSVEVSQYPSASGTSIALTITRPNQRFTVSGSVVTLQRDLYCVNLTLDSSNGAFSLITNGYRIFCLGTFLINAGITVHNNGFDASGITAGTNARAGTVGRAVGAGGAGRSSSTNSGIAAAAVTASAATLSTTAVQSGGQGGYVVEVGVPTNYNAGGAGGTVINAATNGWPGAVPAIIPLAGLTGTLFAGGSGGGGGAIRATAGGAGTSGAGGGGAGVVAIFARQLVNFGTISANGGAGSAANAADATDAGFAGGGGGGGGVVALVFGATGSLVGQVLAQGGAAGGGLAGSGGAGTTVEELDFGIWDFAIDLSEFGPGGGTGGAAASAGATYTQIAGMNGYPGLVWALPL